MSALCIAHIQQLVKNSFFFKLFYLQSEIQRTNDLSLPSSNGFKSWLQVGCVILSVTLYSLGILISGIEKKAIVHHCQS